MKPQHPLSLRLPFGSLRVHSWLTLLALLPLAAAAQTTIKDLTIPSGQELFLSDPLLVNTEGTVVVQANAKLTLWTGGRINLRPGFKAETGSIFLTVYDSDFDGFSDKEESIDTDGDGMFDAWEMRHFGGLGANPNADADSDGMSNRDELLNGRDPNNRLDSDSLPLVAGYRLFLSTPVGFFGITSEWAITARNP